MASLIEYQDLLFSSLLYIIIIFIFTTLILVRQRKIRDGSLSVPTNWPLVGMLPTMIHNVGRMYDYMTEVLAHTGGTFLLKGPCFTKTDMLFTCDPLNVNHVLSKNFNNYPKGSHFQRIFGVVFGEGIFNCDFEAWELHRRTTTPLVNQAEFRRLLDKNVSRKIEEGLFSALDRFVLSGVRFDLETMFRKLAFDIGCLQFLDQDPDSLGLFVRGEDHPFDKAMKDAVNAILYRHVLPVRFWGLQKWIFGVDREKKLYKAGEVIREFVGSIISERIERESQQLDDIDPEFSMLTSHLRAFRDKSLQFLTDTFVTLIIAGQDTTSSTLAWLFLLLAKNPSVEAKILEEIHQVRHVKSDSSVMKDEECRNLVYLHAALCETLRLYPPLAMNIREVVETDVLPSGHVVTPDIRVVFPVYTMGRLKSIWGEDCEEFKPERWISPEGRLKHHPSYKFTAFSSGPRTCMGKEMSFIVMKMVAANMIRRYRFHLTEPDRPVQLSDSLLLQMKHGLEVRFSVRDD